MDRAVIRRLVRFALIGICALTLFGVTAVVGAYFYVADSLPQVDGLADYHPPIITRVLAEDGTIIAEFYRERRIPVPFTTIPQQLVQAFVAAEDAKFFEHPGIDLVSIFRAALKNIAAGGIVQGGSTITQQVAKTLLLTPEKKFSRKFKEAILAWRMEKALSKEDILYLYLNQIYLGHGAYGVQAAAENYFAKNVEELTLAEAAMLAGLPQAPSRYSPYRHFDRAKERQRYVLSQMVDKQYLTQTEADTAIEEKIKIHPRVRRQIPGAAYFTEQVRRYLIQTFGEDAVYKEGLVVHTTMNVNMQQAAQKAVRENLHEHAKRSGFNGPLRILDPAERVELIQQQADRLRRRPLEAGEFIEVILDGVSAAGELEVAFGPLKLLISKKHFKWAKNLKIIDLPPETEVETLAPNSLPIGSVVLARVVALQGGTVDLELSQPAEGQGALVALDPSNGAVKAMVGGYDFNQSQFNRAIQARRLPGSAMKPLIYAAALDKGYTPATMVLDTPIIYRERTEVGGTSVWKPSNYGRKFYGPTSLRTALTKSRNVITIKVLQDIGVDYAVNYARKLGIESPLNHDLTLGLGSSAVTPLELATAYTVFANGGIKITPNYLLKVFDRYGRILESVDPSDFPNGTESGQRLLTLKRERVISQETAYLISNLMESVVRNGTGWRAKVLGRPVAGKTGTTNNLIDAWFVGFIPQLVAVTWVGYDQERPLGRSETGSRAAAPAWVAFMQEALADIPPKQFPVPDGIEFHAIDSKTGLLSEDDSPGPTIEAFAPGTAPTEFAIDEQRPTGSDFFRLDRGDL
ncbi:MAG: penicillin-binding protein [Desulfuromonas sp.]|mgnify:CR=1 FL=1|nr:MAG: penicillin-binding protein [Desulfuromonas sp.]